MTDPVEQAQAKARAAGAVEIFMGDEGPEEMQRKFPPGTRVIDPAFTLEEPSQQKPRSAWKHWASWVEWAISRRPDVPHFAVEGHRVNPAVRTVQDAKHVLDLLGEIAARNNTKITFRAYAHFAGHDLWRRAAEDAAKGAAGGGA